MPRNRRARPELSASWDDVEESDEYNAEIYSEEDERSEVGSRYLPDRPSRQQTPRKKTGEDDLQTSGRSMASSRDGPLRKRMTRSSVEPDLVMPSSPDGERGARKAGMRASTPHFRMNQRSFTSDAGRFGQPAPREQERSSRLKDEYDDQIDDESDLNFLSTLWTSFLRPVVSYVGGSLGMALNNLKPIIGWAIVVWLVFGILTFGGNFFAYKLNQALSPLCRIPGVSYLDLPFCPTASETSQLGSGPAEFDKLVQAQSAFEDVLQSTSHGVNLPMDMKRSEASIRDLKHVVQYSTLPSRNELVFEFGGFIDTARQASHDLSKFNSRIGRAVDQILSTNRWTLNVIDGVQAADANRGSIARWASRNLNILAPFQPVLINRDILLEQYLRHTTAIEDEISTLIAEAQALLAVLDNLDNRLDVIASIATRDGVKALADKNELFEYLWTKLGGNKNSVERLNSQLSLLKDVGTYRTNAWNLVSVTIVKLQAIRDQLEDLRERVALPEVVGDKVPLEVHVESINLGIERLEGQRERGRRLAEESYARVIGKGEGKGLAERLEVGRE